MLVLSIRITKAMAANHEQVAQCIVAKALKTFAKKTQSQIIKPLNPLAKREHVR